MNDNGMNDSQLDLDKLLEEYSSINQSRSNKTSENTNPQEKKKFVLHIDESLIDVDETVPSDKSQNNNGGIYFSSYTRNRTQNNSHQNAKSSKNNTGQKTTKKPKSESKSSFKNDILSTLDNMKIGSRATIIFLCIIFIGTTIFSYFTITCIGDMLAINRSEENVEVMIPPEATYTEIIDILEDNNLIKRKLFCKLFVKYRNFDEETYLSGNYYLNSAMGVEGMLKDLMAAPITADTIKLSFPEGWTVQQIFEKLEKNDVCDTSKLYSAIRSSSYTYDFYTALEDTSNRYLKLEGYLFPDTYDFYVNADTNYVIKKFLDNFKSKWTDEYQARAEKLGYTCDEIICIASIIQKEAANVEQMKIVSSVLHNRLRNPADYPTLGCDSTAIYISNYVTPVVGEAAGHVYYNAYDTSAVRGLPPGPICNPGMDAIKAALYPEDTNYFFFAHDNSGEIYLAETLNGHKNNLVKIIQANNSN